MYEVRKNVDLIEFCRIYVKKQIEFLFINCFPRLELCHATYNMNRLYLSLFEILLFSLPIPIPNNFSLTFANKWHFSDNLVIVTHLWPMPSQIIVGP